MWLSKPPHTSFRWLRPWCHSHPADLRCKAGPVQQVQPCLCLVKQACMQSGATRPSCIICAHKLDRHMQQDQEARSVL